MPVKSFSRPLHANEHCRHYSYTMGMGDDQGPHCAKGISLSAPGASRMCMPRDNGICAQRENFTDEEKAAWKVWQHEAFTRLLLVMVKIPSSENKKEDREFWGKAGHFECPACGGGKVRWTRAPNNGHIGAACSTPNCFSVIQ